ncbi:MAG: hypothetical protein WD844_04575 [Thermoleophilaceae bacterium]
MAPRDEIRLEVLPGTAPIAGSIHPGSGEPLSFTGYVELIAALEAVLHPRSVEGSPPEAPVA